MKKNKTSKPKTTTKQKKQKLSKQELYDIKHMTHFNWPNCDEFGCGFDSDEIPGHRG